MKHAILITAYKDFEQLENLVNELDENFNVYIHIDKKSKLEKNTIKRIENSINVKSIERKYKVNWGGFNHLKAYLSLSEKALKNKDNKYFHLITGQDYPIKNSVYFNQVLNKKEKTNYLEHSRMPANELWNTDGGMGRLEYYNFYDLFNIRSIFGKKCLNAIRKLQTTFNFKRNINIQQQLYGGSTYWTLKRDCLQYVINFTETNPDFIKRFKYTFCPEEMYFQTVVMNSEYAENTVNKNLRFIDWQGGKNGGPAFLNESDFDRIVKTDNLFARKIDSKKLKQKLTFYRNNNTKKLNVK